MNIRILPVRAYCTCTIIDLVRVLRVHVLYLLRITLMQIGVLDPALSLAGGALAKSYSARNLSPRPNAWRQYSFFW